MRIGVIMKKLFVSITLLATIFSSSAFGAVASLFSGGWATYIYICSGIGTAGLVFDVASGNIRTGYDSAKAWYAAIGIAIMLDEDSKRATFPELTKDLTDKVELTELERDSYNRDLKALRLTLDHLATQVDEINSENAQEVVNDMDNVFSGNFSEHTMSAVDKIRSFNSAKIMND